MLRLFIFGKLLDLGWFQTASWWFVVPIIMTNIWLLLVADWLKRGAKS